MRRTGRGGARRALALAAVALVACLCAGAAFAAGGDRGESGFASDVNDVPALAVGRDAGQQVGQDASGDAGDGSDQAGGGLQLSKTAKANDDGSYTVTLEAYATGSSTTTVVKGGADIVLMLDLSDYMYGTKYGPVSGDTTLGELYAGQQSGTVYYVENDGSYQKVTVSQRQVQQGGRPGPGSTPTYTYSVRNGVTGDSLAIDIPSDTTLTSAGLSLFSASTDKDNPAKLTALKTAVNGFIDKVHDEAPASRIAIVTYAAGAAVESGSKSVADEALVEVDDSGAANLKAIVNGLAVKGGASNSHFAAADAVKIFQDVPADSAEYKRPRFALLFSAGVSGTGWATTDADKDLLTSGQSVAWATMSQALVLKTERGQTAQVPANQNMDNGAYWGGSNNPNFRGTDIYKNTVYAGCGATVYCVGLDIQTSGDCSKVDMHDEPFKSGALANEYFWRTSSDRPNGTHITRPSDLGSNGQSTYDNRLSGTTYDSYYYFYPDSLTRNQGSGHYMTTTSGSASDLAKLNDIFAEIASSVVTGVTTSTTLGTSAEVKDVVAPQFTVPESASDIKIYTAQCAGVSGTTPTFGNRAPATGVTATISDSTLSVTGFDFSNNWCGSRTDENGATTYGGKKLIIEFNVKAREGFLGGNDVCTNDSAGVYADGDATEPVQTFEKPTVNVPIETVTATAPEKNVYLLGSLTAEQIKSGAKVACGGVELDLSKADQNYGLESWQTDYVKIEVSYTDASGNAVAGLNGLKDDATYTVAATVSPKTDGYTTDQGTVATAETGNATGNINVFKPELTFKDSEVWYGGDAPTDYSGNKTSEAWKHGATSASSVTMIGTAPNLSLAYAPEIGKLSADSKKIASKDDFAVDVTVKIGATDVTDSTAFVHTKCGTSCTDPSAGEFWLHVKTCSLTVAKAFDAGSAPEPGETFLFAVSGGDVPVDVEVTLCADARGAVAPVTVSGLPVGSYAVAEDGNWSWRYEQTTATGLTSGKIVLGSQAPNGEVAFTNKKTNDKWLDFSGWCRNLFKGSGVYDGVGVGQVTGGATRPAAQAS